MSAPLLRATYEGLVDVLARVDEPNSWAPTGCLGWSVRDLTFHLIEDARRALVALHTPADGPPDTDRVSYWAEWGSNPAADADGRRFGRVLGSMFREWDQLRGLHAETARAAVVAAEQADAGGLVSTQGHTLPVPDLLSTLTVEATIHHLDLVVDLPGRPGPGGDGLREARRVVNGVAADGFPDYWADVRVVLVGTGRAEPTVDERADIAELLSRLPLFA